MIFIYLIYIFSTVFNFFAYPKQTNKNKIDSLPTIISWNYNEIIPFDKYYVKIDTSIENFYNYNTADSLLSFIYNSNQGTPLLSNVFSNRKNFNFYFLNYHFPYIFSKSNDFYINTRKPFSKIVYINGGPSSAKEESINVIHTQNVNPFFNFGINFFSGSSQGYLQWNKTKRNCFKIFSSYESKKYNFFATFRINKFSYFENGGIVNDSLIFDENYVDQGDLPVNLSGQGTPPHEKANVINSFKIISTNFNQNFSILNLKDSLKTLNISIFNSIELEFNKRNFVDISPLIGIEKNFISNLFFNKKSTIDSLSHNYLSITNGILFNKNNIKFLLSNFQDFSHFYFFSKDESRNFQMKEKIPFFYSFNYSNNGIKSGIFLSYKRLKVYSSIKYTLYGYQANSSENLIGFEINLVNNNIQVNFKINKTPPSILYQKYFSNNFIWDYKFNYEKTYNFSFFIKNPYLSIKLENFILNNYTFFNKYLQPEQYSDNIVINSLTIKNYLKIGKLTLNNDIVLQKSSNNEIISLPLLILNHSLCFNQPIKFNFTGGLLETSTGYELKYYSSFYAQKYSPYLSTFYQQTDKKIGDYPLFNVFLQIKLKRVRFFIKYEHVNYKLLNKEYFAGIGYPLMERTLKYGISWHFYD